MAREPRLHPVPYLAAKNTSRSAPIESSTTPDSLKAASSYVVQWWGWVGGLAGGRRPTTSWDPFSASPQFSPAVAPYQMQPAYQLQQLQQRQQQQQMQVQMQMQQYVISKEEEEEERKKRGREDGGTKRTSPLRW